MIDAMLEQRDMTRADLARKLGKSRQTLQGILDTGNPRLSTLKHIGEALDLSDNELASLANSTRGK